MKPGIKRIISGAAVFFIGMILLPATIVITILKSDASVFQFKAPGTAQVTLGEPGRYYLWNDFKTLYEGRSYNRSKDIPDGLNFLLKNAVTGQVYRFIGDTSLSSQTGSSSKKSIGYIEIESPAKVVVEISGPSEVRIYSLSKFNMWTMMATIVGGIGISILVDLTGIGLVVWGILTLSRHKSKDAEKKSAAVVALR